MSPRRCSFSCPTSRATLRVRCWSSTAGWCCDRFPTPPLRGPMAMDMKQLEEKVKDIIVEELGVERDKLTSDASFMEDLGADRFDTVQSPVKFACEVKGFEPARFLDKKEVRRYDLFAQFAVGAAEQAVTDACLTNNWDKVDLKRVGAIVGTGTGGLETFEQNARALFEKGPSRVSPFFVPMYMPNVAAALISMRYGAKGPNYCTVSACASSAHSVGDALELIRHDRADIMIAGGAEAAITPLAVASFANMKALSERNDSPETASRPFDKDRDGFVMGDGAGVLILEEWEHARRRGAKIYAEVV